MYECTSFLSSWICHKAIAENHFFHVSGICDKIPVNIGILIGIAIQILFHVADRPPIDFSIGEDSLEQPAAARKLPPGAPGLAKITLVVTEEGGERVRLTLHDITARLLGVGTPLLPSITERRKLALEYAEVWRAHLIG